LEEFLYFGGYPRASEFRKDCTRWRSYLRDSIIESVIGKDILRFAEVRKPALFRQCFELVTSLPAQEVSYNKLLGQLQEGGNTDLVKYYLELFQGAFLVKSLFKFSDSNLRKKSSSPKILPLCPALASHHYDLEDLKGDLLGRMFEVAVGQVLAQLPGDLTYWREQDGKFEVDYIYQDGKKLFAIEVKSGRKKSQRGLQEFLKRHPRAVGGFIDTNNFEKWAKAPLSVMAKWV
jgi:predicted AAA+ superfamily ATPase